MREFNYVAVSASGAELKGNIDAETSDAALLELKNRGLLPVSIREPSVLSKDIDFTIFQKKPKPRDLSIFCRQFVSILDAGVPVVSALEMLSEQTENKMLSKALTEIRLDVEKGETLTSSMEKYVKIFGSMFISLIAAGESSGSLSNSFTRMASQYEKDARLSSMLKKASIYPTIILIVTIGVIAVMLVMVVPTFQDVFDQLESELPVLTQGVIAVSKFLQSYWYLVLLVVVPLILFIATFAKSIPGKYFFGSITLKLPFTKSFVTKTLSARMSRTLSTLIGSGLPLIESLEITAGTMSNLHFRDALIDAREDVAMGTALSETLRDSGIFPPLVYQMLKIGEETGNIEGMLSKIADYYEEESEAATAALMAMLEPAITIIMAAVVGVIIMSVMLPLGSMYAQLDNL
jgi:type IV pilus assembly protein PilC